MTTIIPRKRKQTRYQQYQQLQPQVRDDWALYWEIDNALWRANMQALNTAIWKAKNPPCADHDMRFCPICNEPESESPPACYNVFWSVQ